MRTRGMTRGSSGGDGGVVAAERKGAGSGPSPLISGPSPLITPALLFVLRDRERKW